MKIESYKKTKSNIYEITLSNKDKICLYDNVILKYDLLLKKEIEDNLIVTLLKDNSIEEAYYKALKYINTKMRTEKEIRLKLKEYDSSIIDKVIIRLYSNGLINDELYIKSFINDSIYLKNIGPNKIKYELKKLGFNETLINKYLDDISQEDMLDKIEKIVNKKKNSNHKLSASNLISKIRTELLNKGFFIEDINDVLSNYDFVDESKIIEQEYNKLKNKLSKKYSGNELEYMIKIHMQKKGFKKGLE